MKPLMIFNPRSGGGKTGRQASKLEREVRARLGEIDHAPTEHPRHAVEIAKREALHGRDTFFSVGGDGTIHEVVNGLMRAKAEGAEGARVGIIGQGTGGDLRKTLGLHHQLDSYLSAIEGGKTRTLDVGRFAYVDHQGQPGEDYFINILSMGMGGLVDQYVATLGRKLPGVAAYFVATLGALVQSEVGRLRCILHNDGETTEELFASRNLAICNGRFFGSGMEVGPMAVPDDGLFHIVSLPALSRLGFTASSLSVYSGKHVTSPHVHIRSCERIQISLDNPEITEKFLLDVDGEPLGKLPIDVELVPKAIEFFVP